MDRNSVLLDRGPDGEEWHLVCEMPSEHVYILERSGPAFGAMETQIEVGAYLSQGIGHGQEALLSLIGTLVY